MNSTVSSELNLELGEAIITTLTFPITVFFLFFLLGIADADADADADACARRPMPRSLLDNELGAREVS